jgi:parallel beta-helix repeat protein
MAEPLAYAGLSLLGLRQVYDKIYDLENSVKELGKIDPTVYPSYILYDSGLKDALGRAIIYAKNCRTGLIEFKGDALIVLNSVRDASPENATLMFKHGDYILSSRFTSSKKLRFIGEGSGTRLLPSGSFDAIDPLNLSLLNIVWRDRYGVDRDESVEHKVVSEASYIIYKEGDMIYAKNGRTGAIEFSGTDASAVIQAAINALSNGGKILIKKDTYHIGSEITLKPFITIEGEGWSGRTSELGFELLSAPCLQATSNMVGKTIFKTLDQVNRNIHIRNLIIYSPMDSVDKGIELIGARSCLIEGVKVAAYIKKALRLIYATDGSKPEGCIIRDNHFAGMAVYRTTPVTDTLGVEIQGSDHRIERNLIGQYYNGELLYGTGAVLVLYEHICATRNFAFMISGGVDNRVIGAEIEVNDGFGMELLGATRNQIIGCRFAANSCHGLRLRRSSYNLIQGCLFYNNSQGDDNVYDDLHIGDDAGQGSTYNLAIACIFRNVTVRRTKYNIREGSLSDYNKIFDNESDGNFGTKMILVSGLNTVAKRNDKYVTENSGTATIAAGNTYVDVTHGLSITPDINKIRVTPKDNLGGRSFWVSDVGASTFRINISSTDTADHSFGWSYEN